MTPESSNNLDLIKSQLGMGSAANLQKVTQGLDDAKKSGSATDAQKKRWKASLDFEAMFLGNMYKSMRQSTIGEGDELTKASPGREIFTEMLDNQYASLHSKSKLESGEQGLKNALSGVSNGMAAQIYRALARREEGKDPAANKDLPPSAGQKITMPPYSANDVKDAADDGVEDAFSATPGLGRVVRKPARPVQQTSAPAPAMTDEALNPIVNLASKTYGVAASLIKSVIKTESANQPTAVSGAGAKGLMQLMDSTARDMGVSNVFNAHDNVLAGTRYLKQLLERFQGNEEKALAAYNAGPATVDRFGGVPPYAETQDYIKKVLKNKSELEGSAPKAAGAAAGN